MTKEELHAILVKARNELEGHWTQGTTLDLYGNRCIIGHFYRVNSGPEWRISTSDAIVYLLHKGFCSAYSQYCGIGGVSSICSVSSVHQLVGFNDSFTTTEDDVLNYLDECIAKTAPDPEHVDIDIEYKHEVEESTLALV